MSLTSDLPRVTSPAVADLIRKRNDEVTAKMDAMTAKWGSGRLRLLVDEELRQRFDKQRLHYNRAVWSGDWGSVDRHAAALLRGYDVLDDVGCGEARAAANLGAQVA
jgi:hypothetical protein